MCIIKHCRKIHFIWWNINKYIFYVCTDLSSDFFKTEINAKDLKYSINSSLIRIINIDKLYTPSICVLEIDVLRDKLSSQGGKSKENLKETGRKTICHDYLDKSSRPCYHLPLLLLKMKNSLIIKRIWRMLNFTCTSCKTWQNKHIIIKKVEKACTYLKKIIKPLNEKRNRCSQGECPKRKNLTNIITFMTWKGWRW